MMLSFFVCCLLALPMVVHAEQQQECGYSGRYFICKNTEDSNNSKQSTEEQTVDDLLNQLIIPEAISSNEQALQYIHRSLGRRLERALRRGPMTSLDADTLQTHLNAVVDGFAVSEAEKRARHVNPYNKLGPYLTPTRAGNAQFYDSTLDKLNELNASALVFDVKGSFVYFATDSALAEELTMVRPLYDLPELVQKAREKGIYTIARFIAVKDFTLVAKHPHLGVEHPASGNPLQIGWTQPTNETVLEYNRQILYDVAKSGIDEINLDYIRYSTAYPGIFRQLDGEQKSANIEAFVRMAREVIDEANPQTKLGISTFAILGWNFDLNVEHLGQDVRRLAAYVDVISPMAYPQTFSVGGYYTPGVHPRSRMYWLVYRTLTGYQEILGDSAYKLRPWIQGYFVTNKNMRDQIDAVYDSGACGFTVWNANSNYGVLYAALRNWEMPEQCRS